MDKQWALGVYKKDRDLIKTKLDELASEVGTTAVAQLDTILNLLKSGGTTATLLDSLQAKVDLVVRHLLNHPLGACGLAEGTNANTLKTVAAIDYVNQGLLKSKGITDNIAMTACAQQAVSKFAKYLITLQADGTLVVTKGADAASAGAALLPATPANETPIAYVQVQTDGATTFTSGTTDLGAAGLTVTFVDLDWPTSGTNAITVLGALTHPATATLGTSVSAISGLQPNP